jgi:hypothetical protein
MSRSLILALGAIVWALAALDAIVHVADGNWMAPGLAGVVLIVWIGARVAQRLTRPDSDAAAAAAEYFARNA